MVDMNHDVKSEGNGIWFIAHVQKLSPKLTTHRSSLIFLLRHHNFL